MAPEVRKCTPKPGLVILLVLGLIPGVLCDNYNLSGLVASSIAAVFYLILLTAVITMGIIWHRWFPRYQLARNKVKIPRHIRFAQLHGSRVEIIEPESRSLHLTSYPPSMRSTKVMVPTATTYQKADSWIKEQRKYEDGPKESVMNFDEEEGDVIVTEVGPEVEIPKSRLNTTIQVDPDKNTSTNNNATDDEISRLNRRQSELTNTQGITGVFNFDDEDPGVDSNIGNEGTVLY